MHIAVQIFSMKTISGYRIISYILLPIAGIFGLMCLLMLIISLGNPATLIPVLIMCAVVVYIITSFIFLIKGIDQLKKCKPSLRSLIKTTAYISLFFIISILFQGITLLYKPSLLNSFIDQTIATQKNMTGVTPEFMLSVVKGLLYFMIFFATTLLIHVFETFKFLKLYAGLFEKE